jgi:hypothetical protein
MSVRVQRALDAQQLGATAREAGAAAQPTGSDARLSAAPMLSSAGAAAQMIGGLY